MRFVYVCVIVILVKLKGPEMKIDKHIPPPPAFGQKYPFRHMEPGDSVFFPGENKSDKQHPAYMTVRNYVKRDGWRVAVRSVVENGVKGIRIWRVE